MIFKFIHIYQILYFFPCDVLSNSGPIFANVAFGVSSYWLVFINLCETCENVGEESGVVLVSGGFETCLAHRVPLSLGHSGALAVCSFLQTWHGEELAELVVGNNSGMYKAGFAGDDAPRAVPSDVRHDSWYGPEGRKKLALHILQRRLQEGGRLLCSEECLQSYAKAASRGTGPKYKYYNDEE